MRDPLLLPVTAVISGILLGHYAGVAVREVAWPTAAFFLLAILARSPWLRRLCIGLALVCAGLLAEAWHRPGPPPEIDAGYKETVLLDGCVVDPTVFSPGREQFTMELAPGARARASLALDDTRAMQKLDYGQQVEIEGRVRSPHNYNNPGAFDYTAYLARQHIFWTATMTRGSAAKILPGRCGTSLLSAVYHLRTTALER